MELRVGNRVISKYNSVAVSLKYDSVGSTFAINCYFDPFNADDRKTFVPGNYLPAVLTHEGETLITGVMLMSGFRSSAIKHLIRIGGYSKSGVLDDCQNPVTNYPLQLNNSPSLADVAKKLIAPFGLQLIVDSNVSSVANAAYPQGQTFEPEQTIKSILSKMASQLNVVLSHDVKGNLLLTRANTSQAPAFNFDGGYPATEMELSVDGQQLHSIIWANGQATIGSDNASQDEIENPYVLSHVDWMATARLNTLSQAGVAYATGYRPSVSIQTSGGDNDTPLTARQLLSQELKAIKLSITIVGWKLGGNLVRPNTIVTVVNNEICLYQKSRWFVESVDFRGDTTEETATLNCVLPECYNNEAVKNIFTGSNLTVPISDEVQHGAHATITPFV